MGRPKKTHYKRSTPVIRLRRNLFKLDKGADLVSNRLKTWQSSGDSDLVAAHEIAKDIQKLIVKLDFTIGKLDAKGFVPPKRSSAIVYEEGQSVAVLAKYRPKYEAAFERVLKEDPYLLDDLVVVKIIPSTGEVVVQRGQRTPFIVRKSHIAKKV